MICFANLAFFFLHLLQFFSTSWIASLALIIQNQTDNFANNWLVPIAWWVSSWCCLIISLVTLCPLGKEHGQKLCDILKLSKFSIFYEKLNNSWTKSWTNMKFQLSIYLIILQSLEFQYFLKKCLFCGY